jgi:hypothetical protein
LALPRAGKTKLAILAMTAMTTSNSRSVNPASASNLLGAASFDETALVEGQAVKPTRPGQSSKPVVFIAKIKHRFRSQLLEHDHSK